MRERFRVRGAPAGRWYTIVECPSCGFQWASPPPSRDEIAAHYSSIGPSYSHYVHARELKKAHFRRKFDEVAQELPRSGRLLDVGCAAGFLLEAARERGFQPTGVELNRGFEAFTAPEVRPHVVYCDLLSFSAPQPYEVITLFDVLEHSPTPRADLVRCREILAPGGVLVVQLPCIDSLGRRLLGRRWFHYGPPDHLSYFDAGSFGRLATSVGFRVVRRKWTRKHMTLDYLASQLAQVCAGVDLTVRLPGLGRVGVNVPMSEALFVLAAG
ncbi:MAG: class I SAM-dependent methyltransferase [Deltaproteobacteria bacterium]